LVTAAVMLLALTLICVTLRKHLSLAADRVAVPAYRDRDEPWSAASTAVATAVAGSLLLTTTSSSRCTRSPSTRRDIVALVIFVWRRCSSRQVVDLAARRSSQAARASAEAETLSTFAGSLLAASRAAGVARTVRETFAMAQRQPGPARAARHRPARVGRPVGPDRRGGRGPTPWPSEAMPSPRSTPADPGARAEPLPARGSAVLSGIRGPGRRGVPQRLLAEAAAAVEPLAESERRRTALLNARPATTCHPVAAARPRSPACVHPS